MMEEGRVLVVKLNRRPGKENEVLFEGQDMASVETFLKPRQK